MTVNVETYKDPSAGLAGGSFENADCNSKKSRLIHMHHVAHDWLAFMMVNVETYKDPPSGLAGGSLKMLTVIVRSPV